MSVAAPCAASSLSAGIARSAARVPAPMLRAKAAPFGSTLASAGGVNSCIGAPLSPIAPAISPRDKGDAISALTQIDPADSPPIVIWLGAPPNAALLPLTQANPA